MGSLVMFGFGFFFFFAFSSSEVVDADKLKEFCLSDWVLLCEIMI
jgi:hypothetical protein